jgi:hypothetical protein
VLDGRFVFAQLMDFVPRREFNACVRRYRGDRRGRGFSCRDQFLCMGFAQLTFREGLRDIETCLRAVGPKLYHAGFRGKVSRSMLADANQAHDWRIYADFAQILIRRARKLYAQEPLGVDLAQTVYALDSTTIDLCLSLFPWAKFRRRKGAVKLHTLLDLRGSIPCFVHISPGKMHDVNILDRLPIEPGAFYVMDRGYIDFQRLFRFTTRAAFFVTRGKRNLDCTRRARRPVDKTTGLRSDQTIVLCGPNAKVGLCSRVQVVYTHRSTQSVQYVSVSESGPGVSRTAAFVFSKQRFGFEMVKELSKQVLERLVRNATRVQTFTKRAINLCHCRELRLEAVVELPSVLLAKVTAIYFAGDIDLESDL